MLVTSRDTKRWIVPKGWPEGEESLEEAAAREAHGGGRHQRHDLPNGDRQLLLRQAPGDRAGTSMPGAGLSARGQEGCRQMAREEAPHAAVVRPGTDAATVQEPDLAELIAAFGVNPRQFAA
jgi:hypothetical protein